jgi:hypothetical protein
MAGQRLGDGVGLLSSLRVVCGRRGPGRGIAERRTKPINRVGREQGQRAAHPQKSLGRSTAAPRIASRAAKSGNIIEIGSAPWPGPETSQTRRGSRSPGRRTGTPGPRPPGWMGWATRCRRPRAWPCVCPKRARAPASCAFRMPPRLVVLPAALQGLNYPPASA